MVVARAADQQVCGDEVVIGVLAVRTGCQPVPPSAAVQLGAAAAGADPVVAAQAVHHVEAVTGDDHIGTVGTRRSCPYQTCH